MPLILILLYPLAEIAAFIVVGREIGIISTLTLIVLSSVLGMSVLRGAGTLTALRLQRRQGNPHAVLAEGGVRMTAGLLLLLPGFLTDIAAIGILLPPVRRFLLRALKIVPRATGGQPSDTGSPLYETPSIIDGDFRRLDG